MRRRYRRIRREMITELRGMLKDRINNYLTIVLMSVTHRRDQASASERELLEAAIAATAAVSRVLEELSMESLRAWKAKYQLEGLPLSFIPGGASQSPTNGQASSPASSSGSATGAGTGSARGR
jgi:hypothetical protein